MAGWGYPGITCPEQADIAVGENVLRGSAGERHIDVMWFDELKLRPAFQIKGRRWYFMRFKRIVFEFPEMHRRQERFEEDTAVILALTAEDVFQVQTSIFFYEEAAGAGSIFSLVMPLYPLR